MEININNAMDNFLNVYFGSKRNNQVKLEKYLTKIIKKNKIKIEPQYRLRSGKIKNGKRIWYTKDFNYRHGAFWRKRVTYSDNCELMEYEFGGNEIYFENKNDIKSCFKVAMKAYSQVIFQMNKCQGNFVTFLQLVETEDENGYSGWDIQIRFYFDRNKRSEVQTLWGNIEDFRNPTLWVYI